ncbi:single-stranded DNA-binding protein [Streptobacillus felis]|uniref:Single-stranded DNA-binding protein n=1 Tax=Streptobacillus felis TaxID=1384509 RepID=A0A7Z0PFN0_9FUSO|nr:single-stranded DNA-binding protein [Streptobacillus felis]NYV28331.1 single-stranded DNA-binding protein [Streptobacillus felis]
MNYVSLLGRLTRDPEVQYTGTGKAYLRFSIAVQRENNREEVDFINCVAWEKRAETIGQYFKKGSRILVTGRISVSNYETKDGEKRTSTDVVVNSFEFIESRTESNGGSRDYTSNRSVEAPREEILVDEEDDFPF